MMADLPRITCPRCGDEFTPPTSWHRYCADCLKALKKGARP